MTVPSNPLASRTSRRNFLTAVGLGAAGLGLAACVGPGTTRGNTPNAAAGGTVSMPAPVSAAPVTGAVSFAHWRAEDKATFDTIIAQVPDREPRRHRHPGHRSVRRLPGHRPATHQDRRSR